MKYAIYDVDKRFTHGSMYTFECKPGAVAIIDTIICRDGTMDRKKEGPLCTPCAPKTYLLEKKVGVLN